MNIGNINILFIILRISPEAIKSKAALLIK